MEQETLPMLKRLPNGSMSEAIDELYKFCIQKLKKMWIIRFLPILGTGTLSKEPKYFAFLAGVQHIP
jgi:hypothetical protein